MLEGLPSHGTHRVRLLAAIGSGALLVGVVGVLLLSSIGPQGPNGIAAATASPTQPEGQVADAPTGTPFPSDAPGTHTVQTWDTLYGIAQSLGVSEEQLRYWNYEKYPALRNAPRGIHVGWVLITDGPLLPTPTPRPSRPPSTPRPPAAQSGLIALPHLTVTISGATTITYYPVSGHNPAEINSSAAANIPRDSSGEGHPDAMAYVDPDNSGLEPTYVFNPATGDCTLTGLNGAMTYAVVIPQLVAPDPTHPQFLSWWREILEHVRWHEGHHISIFQAALPRLASDVVGKPCGSFGQIAADWTAAVTAEQAAFDVSEANWGAAIPYTGPWSW